ncbi:MAG: T9SS type A sorting domain-containing protein [Ignavibacteriales bacterium]|nr:T9SS type A sorting domain-containing protein [Ignavibacteriales bacterium]
MAHTSRFTLKDTSSNWTQYQVIIEVPENNVTAISVRPRAYPLWTGVSYYDDFALNALDPAIATSVEKDPTLIAGGVPLEFALLQNYPNPFNPSTTIVYHLPVRSAVTLQIFNIVGQKVATLVEQEQNAGSWSVQWDARNNTGERVSSGIYFYRLSTSTVILTGKMLLLK